LQQVGTGARSRAVARIDARSHRGTLQDGSDRVGVETRPWFAVAIDAAENLAILDRRRSQIGAQGYHGTGFLVLAKRKAYIAPPSPS